MKRFLHYFLGCILFLGTLSCVPSKTKQDTAESLSPPIFPIPPDTVTDSEAKASYIVKNVWSLRDSLTVQMFGGMSSMEQFVVDYFSIGAMADKGEFANSIAMALEKSTSDFYANFLDLAELYLDHATSSIYNEELYASFIEQALKSSVITYADSIRLSERLAGYRKNRVGDIAADFTIYLSDGGKTSLHKIKAPLTVLIFYEPACKICIDALTFMKTSDVFWSLVKNRMLKVICIDMSADTGKLRSLADKSPTWAILGCESEQKINEYQLYYLRAFPTIFLLDQEKRVLLRHLKVDQLEQWLQQNT